jgi:hypothetical protein
MPGLPRKSCEILHRGRTVSKSFVFLTNLTIKTAGEFQTKQRDEFPERPGCANNGMGLETAGKPFLNGRFSQRVTNRLN